MSFVADTPFFRVVRVGFALHWACDAMCSHCFVPLSARKVNKGDIDGLSLVLAKELIEGLPSYVGKVGFSGGEPFLRFELLERLTRIATQAGKNAGVISNGLWIRNKILAEDYLDRLADAGLHSMTFSVDSYHSPSLTDDEVCWLIVQAHQRGILVSLKGPGVRLRAKAEKIIEEKGVGAMVEGVAAFDLEQVGLARELPPDRRHHQIANGCLLPIDPIILPGGNLVACCSARMLEFRNPVHIRGQVFGESIASELDRMERDYVLAAIMAFGPAGVARWAGRKIDGRKESTCQVCVELMNASDLRCRVEDKIKSSKKIRQEIAARIMLLQKELGFSDVSIESPDVH